MLGVIALVSSVALATLTLPDIYLIVFHILQARRRLAGERSAIVRLTSLMRNEPHVCVQLPVHNEAALVGRAIDSLCELDWPRDRLEILILDDNSTDATRRIAEEKATLWAAKGIRVRVHHRGERRGYKAGLLAEGLGETEAPYVAIFDVDYWPSPPTLRQLMSVMLAAPRLAFVQARLDHRNRNRNWLTQAQAMELDTLLAYEHATRNWAGIPITFNGTCAVWSRLAIEEAGGWTANSLVEDQDLSFRALALGWSCRFVATVAVPGELPESFSVLSTQRLRWGAGTVQQLRVFRWALLRLLPLHLAVLFMLLSLFHATVRPLLGAATLLLGAVWLWEPQYIETATVGYGIALGMIIGTKSIGALLARTVSGRQADGHPLVDIVQMWILQACLLPNGVKASLRGLFRSGGEFVRTPKTGEPT